MEHSAEKDAALRCTIPYPHGAHTVDSGRLQAPCPGTQGEVIRSAEAVGFSARLSRIPTVQRRDAAVRELLRRATGGRVTPPEGKDS